MHINERTICSSVFLNMSSSKKGNKVVLATFLNWGKDAIIGYQSLKDLLEQKFNDFNGPVFHTYEM